MGQSAHIFLTVRMHLSCSKHTMAAKVQRLQELKAAHTNPPDRADQDPPEQQQQLHGEGISGSGEHAAHGDAPHCCVLKREWTAGQKKFYPDC